MSSRRKNLLKNAISGFGIQIIIMLLGIIIPRVMITSYGSDVNGLLNAITQIFTYMALLEAGIAQAARNALYKPIANQDKEEFSRVVSIASKYYKKFTVYYGICVIVLSLICPYILKTNIDKLTIFLIIILEGMSGVICFYFTETKIAVLRADGRAYINQSFSAVNTALGYAAKIIMAANGISIVFLQFVYFLISIAKVFFYEIYFNKKYNWINIKKIGKSDKLKDRNSYVITEISGIIFSSTDMIVLSIFIGTKVASVYAVYNLIFNSLNGLMNSVYNNTNYILGQIYHEDKKRYIQLHDNFTTIYFGIMTIFMCTACLLCLPFIKIYTRGITDVDYINPLLPTLFSLVQVLSWSRYITGNLSAIAGYAKQTSVISLIEAVINILLSIVLVNFFGISGVLFATVIALPIKVVYLTWISEKRILKRTSMKYLRILGANYLFFFVVVMVNKYINIEINNYFMFFIYGFIVFLICSFIGIIINLLANPECLSMIKRIKIGALKDGK